MSADLTPLFRPFECKSLKLANRVAMAPMTRMRSPTGVPTDEVVQYYQRRAEAGVGLIITEGTTVNHPAAGAYPGVPGFHGEALEGWQKVVEAVHAAGGALIPQLWHVGGIRRPGHGPVPDMAGYSPSGCHAPGKCKGHAMTLQDINDTIRAFADAARDARAIGCDGIELHGAHGYLIDQFFWSGTNLRDDQYGGSLENRGRFAKEIVEACRAEVGDDFAIVLRWSQWKQQDYTARLVADPEELEAFLAPLSAAGVDIFHCSQRRFWEPEFDGSDLNTAGWVKKITGKPTMSVGSVGLDGDFVAGGQMTGAADAGVQEVDELLRRMGNDEFDLIAVGRALLQDPEWLLKVKEGRLADLKPYDKMALTRLY